MFARLPACSGFNLEPGGRRHQVWVQSPCAEAQTPIAFPKDVIRAPWTNYVAPGGTIYCGLCARDIQLHRFPDASESFRLAMTTERDDLPKHLEFILDVVERHARNTFLLKGWSVTLVAAVFLLAIRGAEPTLAMAAGFLPSLTFWALDAYYLRQERMYRALYNHVRKAAPTSESRFSLDARPFVSEVPGWFRTLGATPVFWFHAAILAIVVVALAFFSLRPPDAP